MSKMPNNVNSIDIISMGSWLLMRWRKRLKDSGYNYPLVARQMRKQGVPLSMAVTILCGKEKS
jgi:hypothetical protein